MGEGDVAGAGVGLVLGAGAGDTGAGTLQFWLPEQGEQLPTYSKQGVAAPA